MLWWQILLIILGVIFWLGIGLGIALHMLSRFKEKDISDDEATVTIIVILGWPILGIAKGVMALLKRLDKRKKKEK